MKKFYSRISPKIKLYIPLVAGIIVAISVITIYSVNRQQSHVYRSLERNLVLEVSTLKKMFEREYALKLEKVNVDLKIIHDRFYSSVLKISDERQKIDAFNQITRLSHEAEIKKWTLDGADVFGNNEFVDDLFNIAGGTYTVFQKSDSGYIRISTNVLRSDGSRAVGTYIPNNSPVAQTISRGETFVGRAFVVDDWYITAYEPVYDNGEIVGMLYAGDKEKDLEDLQVKIRELKIGESGYVYVMDATGKFIIHPYAEGETWTDEPIINQIIAQKTGIMTAQLNRDKKQRMVAFDYFPEFNLYIAASVPVKEETRSLVREIIINSSITALFIIVAITLLIYLMTKEKVRKFLDQLEQSSSKLKSAQEALEQSESHFKTLFNNSSDEIFVIDFAGNFIEVNQVACDTLGYSHQEFLTMNIRDIKTQKFLGHVESNIMKITQFGQYRYESENQAKDGRIIPVEMKSRVIDYKGGQAILTIARDITERKEIEEKILTTIIQTEENERKRFAADLHDDLGPILSTVKLYTDLLKKGNYKKINETEAVKNIEELVDMAIKSTRQIARNIRPNILQDFGLAAAITDFCSFINSTSAITINLNTSAYKIGKRGIEESMLYQAFKELINNTIRHSEAKNVKIELKSFENQIILYYRDDGKGFDVAYAMKEKGGLGLNNIVNRIKSVQGTVDINSEEGKGMFLIASLKIREND
jgi:PAS domain S-box-containing protein